MPRKESTSGTLFVGINVKGRKFSPLSPHEKVYPFERILARSNALIKYIRFGFIFEECEPSFESTILGLQVLDCDRLVADRSACIGQMSDGGIASSQGFHQAHPLKLDLQRNRGSKNRVLDMPVKASEGPETSGRNVVGAVLKEGVGLLATHRNVQGPSLI